MTAAMYTGAPAPTRVAYLPAFRYRATRPTGNCNPALADRLIAFLPVFPLPRPDIVVVPSSRVCECRRDRAIHRSIVRVAGRRVSATGSSVHCLVTPRYPGGTFLHIAIQSECVVVPLSPPRDESRASTTSRRTRTTVGAGDGGRPTARVGNTNRRSRSVGRAGGRASTSTARPRDRPWAWGGSWVVIRPWGARSSDVD